MASVLNEIIAVGGTTAHSQPFDPAGIVDAFISPKHAISCFVALDGPRIVGFQALEWSDPDWPGEDRLPADWAIISTYVAAGARKLGAGRALFSRTRAAATQAGVRFIDATIRAENTGAQAFYDSLGFADYTNRDGAVCKRIAPAQTGDA